VVLGGRGREGSQNLLNLCFGAFPMIFRVSFASSILASNLAETRWTWMIMSTPFSLWRRLCAIGLNRVTWSVTNCYRGERAHG